MWGTLPTMAGCCIKSISIMDNPQTIKSMVEDIGQVAMEDPKHVVYAIIIQLLLLFE